ncbi:hypothetical protein IT408_03860 [Candidatus Uhrbacteria bacterium]|nr:hypothetical protein [Candidatus Uhrbacteria bacterium]
MADTLSSPSPAEHSPVPAVEQIPQAPSKLKESLDESIAEGRIDYLKESLGAEATSAQKEMTHLSESAKVDNDPDALEMNQEVTSIDQEAEEKIRQAKLQAEQEIDSVLMLPEAKKDEPVSDLTESTKLDSTEAPVVKPTTELAVESEVEEVSSVEEEEQQAKDIATSKEKEQEIHTETSTDQSKEKESTDFDRHLTEAQSLIDDFKKSNFQAGPNELRRLKKLMVAAHPDRFPGAPETATAFASLIGRLKMIFGGDTRSWRGFEADFEALKQKMSSEKKEAPKATSESHTEKQSDTEEKQESAESSHAESSEQESSESAESSVEKQMRTLERSAESAKLRMRELYDDLMKMKESGGELDESELEAYKQMLDSDEVLNAFVEKMQSEFNNPKNDASVRARAAQYAIDFAQGARAQLAHAEGIVNKPKTKVQEQTAAHSSVTPESPVATEKTGEKAEEFDEKAETERRMGVMSELLSEKILKVEAAFDEVLESGDEERIEESTQLLTSLYSERMSILTNDINAYYRKKPSERTPKSEKQVGIWLYEEELLGAQMDANLKKREIAALKREKQVIDLEVSDLQALIDKSMPKSADIQLAEAPTQALVLASDVPSAETKKDTAAPEDLAKKLQNAIVKQTEIAAKIGLATEALGSMYRDIDRIVKARAKDIEELQKMEDGKKKDKKIDMIRKDANNLDNLENRDSKVKDTEYKPENTGGGGAHGPGWFEQAGDMVALAMHGDEEMFSAANKLFTRATSSHKKAA